MRATTAYTPIVVDLAQGSPEWMAWRSQGIGSSDAAAILGRSPWKTALELFLEKTGRREPQAVNDAMRRGTELEPHARREFEFEHDGDYHPACLIHPKYPYLKASLDGWSTDRRTVLEIKVPGRKAHAEALAGRVPAYYQPQVNHQLLVSGAERVAYWSYDPDEGGVLVTHERDEARLAELLAAEVAFWTCLLNDEPPAASAADTIERRDTAWAEAAAAYISAEQELERWQDYRDLARAQLLDLAGGQRSAGAGVSVAPREGSIAWKKAASDLADILGEPIDIEKYRGEPTMTVRLSKESELW